MQKIKAYTGIGTRDSTDEDERNIKYISESLSEKGWTVYSGNAPGSDIAFQKYSSGNYVAWLPWKRFNYDEFDCKEGGALVVGHKLAGLKSIEKYHPNPSALKQGMRALMARNYYQIKGLGLFPQSSFVVCCAVPTGNGVKGGTGQAVRIAQDLGLPIINIRQEGWKKKIEDIS